MATCWSTTTWLGPPPTPLNAHRNIDFSGGGTLNGGTTGNVTLSAGLNGSSGAIIGHATNTVVAGDTLIANARTGIGSSATPLQTNANALALQSTVGGGIYVTNTNNIRPHPNANALISIVTVAAASANGDIVIKTTDAARYAEFVGITVGTVGTPSGSLSGLRTTGSGNISLTAGRGSSGNEFLDISGGRGGSITVNAPINSAGHVNLTAGHGGDGGEIGLRASGGSITLNAALNAQGAATLRAGNGGQHNLLNGNNVGRPGFTYPLSDVGAGETGAGMGGAIVVNAPFSAQGAATLIAGDGGYGDMYAGKGGSITLNAVLNTGAAATLSAGKASATSGICAGTGNQSHTCLLPSPNIAIHSNLNAAGSITLTAGDGSSVSSGSSQMRGGDGGGVSLDSGAALTSGQNIRISAGKGGDSASGALAFTTRAGDGGSIALGGSLSAAGSTSIAAGDGGQGGIVFSVGGNGGGISLGNVAFANGDVSAAGGQGGSGNQSAGAGGGLAVNGSAQFSGNASFSAGAGGSVSGTNIDMVAAGNLTFSNFIGFTPASGNVSLRAGMNAGNTLALGGAAISVANPAADNITLQGNSITGMPGALAANTLAITTTGSVGSAATPVSTSANALSLQGSDVYVTNNKAVTVNAGSATGAFYLDNGASDITLAGQVSAQGAGDAIRLAGRNFINNAGASALSAPNGRWIVWSDTPVNDVFGGLQSGTLAAWSTPFNAAAPTVTQTGNRFAFSVAPLSGVAVVRADDKSKVYGDAFTGFTFTASDGGGGSTYGNAFTDAGGGVVNLTGGTPILASTGAAATATRLGGNGGGAVYGITVNVAGLSAAGYSSVIGSGGFLTITPRALTVAASGVSKTYDGLIGGTVTLSDNRVNSDVLSTAYTGAAFLDKHAGVGKTLNVSGISLTGAAAVNYTLASTTAATTADIAQRGLTVSGITAANKTYDGLLTAAVNTGAVALAGLLSGDVVNVTASGAFADKNVNVGPAKTVNLTSTYGGADWLNYNITGQSTATANITARGLTIGATGVNRNYDGTATGTVTLIDNRISGDVLTTSYSGAAFLDKHAGTGKTLNVSGINLTGTDAGNYTFNTTAAAAANIAQAALTLSTASQTRTYDGSTNSSGVVGIAGLFGTDSVTGLTQRFDSRNASAANGRTLLVNSGYTVNDGNGGGNYLVSTVNATGTINQAALTLTATAQTRTYDGTTNSGGVVGVAGLAGGDTLTGATQRFDSANASAVNGRTLLVNGGYTLSDGNGGNNYAVSTVNATGTINQAPLTITANNATKTYGGTLNLAGTEFTSTGLLTGETIGSVSLASTGAASGAIVANSSYPITPSGGVAAAGNNFNLANYLVSYVNGNLTVNRAPLIVTANSLTKVGDSVPFTGGNGVSFLGLVNGETSASVLGSAPAYSGSSQGAVNAGSYVITPGGLSLLSNNYMMRYADGALTITASTSQLPGAQSAINSAQQGGSGGGGSGGGSGLGGNTGGAGGSGGSGGDLFSGNGGSAPEMGLPDGVE